jgi:hypothetical protein
LRWVAVMPASIGRGNQVMVSTVWNALRRRALDLFIIALVAAMAILVEVTIYDYMAPK